MIDGKLTVAAPNSPLGVRAKGLAIARLFFGTETSKPLEVEHRAVHVPQVGSFYYIE